jgi:nucleoid-associated protein YgaU
MRSFSPFEMFSVVNPGSEARLQEHVFNASETVTGLAHRYYRNWSEWRLIADRNRVVDVRRIEPGARLLIPELPLERGRFESYE